MIRPSRLIFSKNMVSGTHPIGMFVIEGLIHLIRSQVSLS